MSNTYPSTMLVDLTGKTDPKAQSDEINKALNDLLDKINKTSTAIPSATKGNGSFPVADGNRSSTLVVNTSTDTAGVWSAAVTMTGVPAGAKAAWCACSVVLGGAASALAVEAATGYTLSDITSGTNVWKYFNVQSNQAGVTAFAILKIHLDANGQFKWCTKNTNTTVQIGSAIDYEM